MRLELGKVGRDPPGTLRAGIARHRPTRPAPPDTASQGATMTTPTTSVGARKPVLMLGLATVGFALNFWAWALLSPLGTYFKDSLDLTSSRQALLVAVPVIVGSLGRIPVGALTNRDGAESC